MKTLATFLQGNKRFFFLCILFSCLTSLLDLANPRFLQMVVDGQLPWTTGALCVIGVAAAAAVCRYLSRLMDAKGSEGLVKRMRDLLYDRAIRLPQDWHDRNQTGDIIQRCTSDVEEITPGWYTREEMRALLRSEPFAARTQAYCYAWAYDIK